MHKKDGRTIVAVCDEEIAGQYFEEGNLQLDLRSDFYKGELMPGKEIGDLMRNANAVNIVGKKAVALGIKEGVIERGNVSRIAGVPYAQAVTG